jgi:hypothetical protein
VEKQKQEIITVQGTVIRVVKHGKEDYVSLTDLARQKNPRDPKDVVKNWMRTRNTIRFLALWEQLNNPRFKGVEIDPLLYESGDHAFTLSPSRWVELTDAIGIYVKASRGGGTFAHVDIALEFASWISSEFKLYLMSEFKRLKTDEQQRLSLEWSLQRTLAKINYRIHTDAIKEQIIPPKVTRAQATAIYASEADLLNVALFGKTAEQWRSENPDASGNIRDGATLEQLIVLSNLESINALLIRQSLPQGERLVQLNAAAITQLTSLLGDKRIMRLNAGEKG